TQDSVILLKEARHPVLERILPTGTFVPNDVFIDGEEDRVLIITGPNMGGKSTYMRQTALNVLLAQMGCFVPAREARIGLVDRLFTRIGAWDDLSSGQSTFMVEMAEVANILNHATSRSLVLLDEIGRGTSTFDGLAIAWAVVEYLQNKERLGARTLLATHYRELIELEDLLEGVKNYSVAVREKGEEMVFLRRVVRGGADGSYGIQVARLAGIPAHVIARAKEILHTLENREQVKRGNRRRSARNQAGYVQLTFFEPLLEPVLEEIRSLDVMNLTPLEALQKIHAWQERLKK
ncbi:MAG: DNA mismatch repair protein MutS, partial [Firmicutes bacterium]|nr:DNA mismatch repair protein MutS [Bacillota bacterium]